MSKSEEPKPIKSYGGQPRIKLDQLLEHMLILNTFDIIETEKDGKPLRYGAYGRMQLTVVETGEVMEVMGGQTYVLEFLRDPDTRRDMPFKVSFHKVGKAFTVRRW